MNTEIGLLCSIPRDEEICASDDFELTKADFLVQAMVEAMRIGLAANVWFSLTGWRNSSLIDASSNPLPAYSAYRFASEELGTAQFIRKVNINDGIEARWFNRDQTIIWVVWARVSGWL
jgi:hypothetical protein